MESDTPTENNPPAPAAPSPLGISNNFYARVFVIATVILLGFLLYKIILPFLAPAMWALFLAFLLHPVHLYLMRRHKIKENISAALLTITAFVMFIGPIAAMSAAFIAQTIELVKWTQEILAKQSWQQYRLLADLPFIESMLQWMQESFGINRSQMQDWLAQGSQKIPQLLTDMGQKIFMGLINTALAFVITLFMFFFILRDGSELIAMLRDMIPMIPARREQLITHMAEVTHAVVFGVGVTALVQGALIGIAFLITGLGSPLVFGVLAALLALLPFGGTAFVWIPAMFFLFGQHHWKMAIAMLTIGILSSTIDNVLRPLLISGRAHVGTLSVFIGVLGGAGAFGPIGIFLGPVVLALIIALMRFALEVRRAL